MITAAELLAASKPLRPRTPEEARRAVKTLGLSGEEEKQRCCTSCATWKDMDEFATRGLFLGEQRYSKQCKECLDIREQTMPAPRRQTRGLAVKDCPGCGVIQSVDLFPLDGKFKDGSQRYHTYCKACKNAKRRELRALPSKREVFRTEGNT